MGPKYTDSYYYYYIPPKKRLDAPCIVDVDTRTAFHRLAAVARAAVAWCVRVVVGRVGAGAVAAHDRRMVDPPIRQIVDLDAPALGWRRWVCTIPAAVAIPLICTAAVGKQPCADAKDDTQIQHMLDQRTRTRACVQAVPSVCRARAARGLYPSREGVHESQVMAAMAMHALATLVAHCSLPSRPNHTQSHKSTCNAGYSHAQLYKVGAER